MNNTLAKSHEQTLTRAQRTRRRRIALAILSTQIVCLFYVTGPWWVAIALSNVIAYGWYVFCSRIGRPY